MIVGKDIEVNIDNEISSKNFTKNKSRSLVIDNGISKLEKSVYTNCKKREGCPPWLFKQKKYHTIKKRNK